MIQIQPIDIFQFGQQSQQAIQIQITAIQVQLDTSATITYQLYDANEVGLYVGSLLIDGTDYSNWGLDDSYIENLLLTKLALTKI